MPGFQSLRRPAQAAHVSDSQMLTVIGIAFMTDECRATRTDPSRVAARPFLCRDAFGISTIVVLGERFQPQVLSIGIRSWPATSRGMNTSALILPASVGTCL